MSRILIIVSLFFASLQGVTQSMPPGEVLFHEDFDGQIRISTNSQDEDQWYSRSMDGVTQWSHESGPNACGDSGYLILPAGRTGVCPAAVIESPVIELACRTPVSLTYDRAFLANQDPTGEATEATVRVLDEQGNSIAVEVVVSAKTPPENCEHVELFFLAPQRFKIEIFGSSNCDPLIIDNLALTSVRLEPTILVPEMPDIDVVRGQPVLFQGDVMPFVPDSGVGWAVKKANTRADLVVREGQTMEYAFPDAGRFDVAMVVNTECDNYVSKFIHVTVHDSIIEFTDPEGSGRRPHLLPPVEPGVPVVKEFVGRVEDPLGLVYGIRWLEGETVTCTEQVTPGLETITRCTITFPEPIDTTISIQTLDANGEVIDRRSIVVCVDPQIKALVEMPRVEERFRVGDPITFFGEIMGQDTQEPDNETYWIYQGEKLENGQVITASKTGRQTATFVAINPRLKHRDDTTVVFRVDDIEHMPRLRIISPDNDWNLTLGDTLLFEASYGNSHPDDYTVSWEILDEAGNIFYSGDSVVLGDVTFTALGVYSVSLFVDDGNGRQEVGNRIIWVETSPDGGSRPGEPRPIRSGRYKDLQLDKEHYYEVNVPTDNQAIQLNLNVPDGGDIVFYAPTGMTDPVCIHGSKTMNLQGLPAGDYTWGILPNSTCTSGETKKDLSFSFSVAVLSPSLYFADILEDTLFSTEMGIVNVTSELAEVTVVGHDDSGNILCQASFEIPAMGSFRDSAANIFGDDAENVTWARVDSTTTLVGFSSTLSLDKLQGYAVSGATLLQPELYVPHIAKDTVTWYTKARVINGSESIISPSMTTVSDSQALENSSSFSKDNVDFLERLGGEITPDNYWATFSDSDSGASLAGTEIFGTIETSQIVGLGLAGSVADNPNFTTGTDKLYIAHIAESNDFWTGLAFVNRAGVAQGAVIKAYDASGVLLDTGTLPMSGYEKVVSTAQGIMVLAGMTVEGAGWLEVTADAAVSGYELFGSMPNPTRLAGIEGITEVKKNLCFPYIDNTGSNWHGVALVNITDEVGEVSFTLRNEVGEAIACVDSEVLNSKQKRIFTVSELFNGIPSNAAWLEVTGTKEMVGFELFGDRGTNQHMSGIVGQ